MGNHQGRAGAWCIRGRGTKDRCRNRGSASFGGYCHSCDYEFAKKAGVYPYGSAKATWREGGAAPAL